LREYAHKLYGSAAYCHIEQLEASARELEQAVNIADNDNLSSAYNDCVAVIELLLRQKKIES